MPQATGHMPHAPCLMPHASCPMPHALHQVRHLDRGKRRFPSFVSTAGRRALDRLLDRVAGDDAERDWKLRLDRHARQLVRDLSRDEVEVRRVAAQKAAESDERVVTAGEDASECRDLECAGDAIERDVLVARAVACEAVARAVEKSRDDIVIEPAGDDPEAQTLRVEIAFERARHAAANYTRHEAWGMRDGGRASVENPQDDIVIEPAGDDPEAQTLRVEIAFER